MVDGLSRQKATRGQAHRRWCPIEDGSSEDRQEEIGLGAGQKARPVNRTEEENKEKDSGSHEHTCSKEFK